MEARSRATDPKQPRAQATRRRLLDAAVDELVASGYARFTTMVVARRAGVSRGAQQGHFPHKRTLVAEAVRHLAQRQIDEMTERLAAVPVGRALIETALDVLFEQYSGDLFSVIVELSLIARGDAEIRDLVAAEARWIDQRDRDHDL